ncbi:MAG: GNAT family N-acetyltransferase [Spirochaetia bacterium]|nr:GNAT family N-acetyltransferase [Spirochaetia bacterium]
MEFLMNEYTITVLPEDQVAEALSLMKRCFETNLHSIFFLHPETTLVALFEGRIVAGLNLDVYKVNKTVTMAYIGWLYTDSNHRGKALAGQLLDVAMRFCKDLGCTDIAGCVEGDNPASFKQLERRGFKRLGLLGQALRFRQGMFRVYHHASRFFDMGYFFWHKCLDGSKVKESVINTKALLFGMIANTLLFLPILFEINIPSLVFNIPTKSGHWLLLLLLPSATLLSRTMALYLVALKHKVPVEYHLWDTAFLTALILPLLTGICFPVPGNIYIKGSDWSLENHKALLSKMALASVVATGSLLMLVQSLDLYPYPLVLLLMDTLFFFYPFCGFNASRINRGSKKIKVTAFSVLLVCLLYLLLY